MNTEQACRIAENEYRRNLRDMRRAGWKCQLCQGPIPKGRWRFCCDAHRNVYYSRQHRQRASIQTV